MKKLLLIVPFLFLGCSAKTQAKIEGAVLEAQKQATLVCNVVMADERKKSKAELAKANYELAKCEKEVKYWENEFKELVNPK